MSWGYSCSIGPDVEEARFLSPMQPYKVTLSVLSRAPPSGGLLTTAASSKLCGPTRTADSQLMHGFNTCHAGRDVGQLLVCAWVAQDGPTPRVCLGGTRRGSAGGSSTCKAGDVQLSPISSSLLCRAAHVQARQPGGDTPYRRHAGFTGLWVCKGFGVSRV